jgi:uncharacterized protein YlxP (DUF503 family)
MNPYRLIMTIQQKMQQDQEFANKFNKAVSELNNVQGLQQQVMKIAQINDENQRQQIIDKLPKDAKIAVKGILELLTNYNLL